MTKDEFYQQLERTKKASITLALLPHAKRTKLLRALALALKKNTSNILKANALDLARLGKDHPLADRLQLNFQRIAALADDVRAVCVLPDPLYRTLLRKTLNNRLKLTKVSVPFGVVGVIYESRPNVTIDAISLSLKSGNALALKGGRDAHESNSALVCAVHKTLSEQGVSQDLVFLIDPFNRSLTKYLLQARKYIDLVIPRGGERLISFVRKNAQVPVIETGAGVCHTYVDASADIDMAVRIIINAKTQRPAVCNSLDTLIVHAGIALPLLSRLGPVLDAKNVEIFTDARAHAILKKLCNGMSLHKATKKTYHTEFLSLKMGIVVVDSLVQALQHISEHSTKHSEAIVAENARVVAEFLRTVDAAAVYHNASTRFTDGGVFGFGAEVGISTQKLHCRGPMGVDALTTYKYIVEGCGQVRG